MQLIPRDLRSSLKKVVRDKRIRHRRVHTVDAGLQRLDTSMMKESNQNMRETFEDNKVIVFPAASLQPWDNVTRFNFLECNLKEVVD